MNLVSALTKLIRQILLAISSVISHPAVAKTPIATVIDYIFVYTSLALRLGKGASACSNLPEKQKQPSQPLQLYEYEGCPFCRFVRDHLTILDLDYICFPTPRPGNGAEPGIHRQFVKEKGGSMMFPYLVDPNTNVSMYESGDIIKYLWENYGGDAQLPTSFNIMPSFADKISSFFASAIRPLPSHGILSVESSQPNQKLQFWGSEGSPGSRLVRERLCSLELPYYYHTSAIGSRKRTELLKKTGSTWIPYLEDPNTGFASSSVTDIRNYLSETYEKKQ